MASGGAPIHVAPAPSPGIVVLDDITCPICCEKYNNPKMFPCGHSFCEDCVKLLVKESPVGELVCPICRESVPDPLSAPINYTLENIARSFQELELSDVEEGQKLLQIFLVDFAGKTMTLNVTEEDTVAMLMKQISSRRGVPQATLRLIYQNKQLEEEKQLNEYGIISGSTIHLVARLLGGSWAKNDTYIMCIN